LIEPSGLLGCDHRRPVRFADASGLAGVRQSPGACQPGQLSPERSAHSMLRGKLTYIRREYLMCYLFMGPALLGFLVFTLGPMFASLYYSLCDYEIVLPPRWIGLENYRRLFFVDELPMHALGVTAYYSFVGVPLRLVAQMLVAILLNRALAGRTVFRTVLYMPSIVSGVALSLLWIWLLNPEFGLINHLLWTLFRIEGPRWLSSPQWVIPAFILMSMWGIGGGIVICLAGLQSIPEEQYEAAELDGAGGWKKLLYVTIPFMSPVLFFNLVMGIIGSFQVFTQSYVMTSGGPSNASLFYVLYLYWNAFNYFRMGFASALAWVLFAVIMLLTLSIFRSSSVWVYYEGSVH
jgi:multiple sugar transport system permease protein